jgi:hypothetical protein
LHTKKESIPAEACYRFGQVSKPMDRFNSLLVCLLSSFK